MVAILAAAAGILFHPKAETKAAPLTTYWTSDPSAAQSLRDYAAQVTDPTNGAGSVPDKDRIAVFDMDGTLTCETYYTCHGAVMSAF